MFSSGSQLNGSASNMEGGELLGVPGVVGFLVGEHQKLCFAWGKLNLMLLAVEDRKVEEALQLVDVIGEESSVIRLAHSCNRKARNAGSEPTLLGSYKLLIIIYFVVLTTVGSALLQPELVVDGAHGVPFPLAESCPVGEAEIPVTYSLVGSSVKIESSD